MTMTFGPGAKAEPPRFQKDEDQDSSEEGESTGEGGKAPKLETTTTFQVQDSSRPDTLQDRL